MLAEWKKIARRAYKGFSYLKSTTNVTSQNWKCDQKSCRGSLSTPINYSEGQIAEDEVNRGLTTLIRRNSTGETTTVSQGGFIQPPHLLKAFLGKLCSLLFLLFWYFPFRATCSYQLSVMTLYVLHHLRFWAFSFGLALLALALLTYNRLDDTFEKRLLGNFNFSKFCKIILQNNQTTWNFKSC